MVKQTIQIFGRIRPTKRAVAVYSVNNEEETGDSLLGFVVPKDPADGFVNNKKEIFKFRFKKVFDQETKQEDLFENVAKPIADSVLDGYNGTIFAYGQTGSGKTFTITGGAERYNDRGLIPRSLSYLFECLNQDSSLVSTIHISYLEIYNECGYDLLDSRREASCLEDLPHFDLSQPRRLRGDDVVRSQECLQLGPVKVLRSKLLDGLNKKVNITEDADQNIHLKNLNQQQASNEEEALNLLFLGDTNRVIAETPINQASTRSHCIFTVHICRREPGSATLRRSKLHLVDLAGSDRVSKSGLDGHLLSEAKYINLSLHCLELVIVALSERNRSHIPYRNSMLTHVLRDSLGGNCMTTMIANMAVDNRNIHESISTCRFAQRVALIKNEAILNEELDPSLLIARLRKEVVSLKEELTMVTGEQRSGQLTVEEIQKLEELVKAYLEDSDPDVTLSLGPDMRKIHHCFSMLKKLILDNQRGKTTHNNGRESPVVRKEAVQDGHESPADVAQLKERLKQRDTEISVLVKMLKKEKKRAQEAIAQLANITGDQSLSSPRAADVSEMPNEGSVEDVSEMPNKGSVDTAPADQGGRAIQYMRRGPQLSMGKQEAYEIFVRNHEAHATVDENMILLKQRTADAKKLGKQLNDARNRINELKKQIEKRRRQRAAQSVLEDHTKAPQEEDDPVEESLRKQVQQESKDCKSALGRLRALRTEIEHLQLLLEGAKVRLQKDFHKWWDQEASSLQESGTAARCGSASPTGTLLPSLPGTPGSGTAKDCSADQDPDAQQELRSVSHRNIPPSLHVPAGQNTVADGQASESAPSSQWRPPEATTYSHIPLTGDAQIDANILAFVRARENLLSRNTSNTHK